jgi:DNA-binding response OmpR family regulator
MVPLPNPPSLVCYFEVCKLRNGQGAAALLVEGEAVIAMDLEFNLQSAGFTVVHVTSCREADQWLDANQPGVAIVDLYLSDETSEGVVRRLRGTRVPFVVYSGDPSSAHAGTDLRHGVWLNKPSTPDEFVEAVRKASNLGQAL